MGATFEKGTAGRLIRLLLLNTLVAICVGLLVANVVRPGHWSTQLRPHAEEGAAQAAGKPDMLQLFLDNVPKSLFGPLTDNGKVIGVIFLALAFGIALRRFAKRPLHTVKDFVDLGLETFVTILHWIIDLIPLAVFGIVASIIGTQGFGPFRALGAFIVAVIFALIIQACYYLVRVWFGSWVNPIDLLRGGRDALVMAFSTASSTVTMPLTFECLRERVGLREKSASLGALVGANFNNDGTALYEAMAALFVSQMLIAQGLGVELTLAQQLLVVITSVIASVGAAGIPEAGLVTMTLVFHAVGLPIEYIALLLPVDWFLDRCRTVINVMGDMNVSCLLDGKTRETPAR
jgi:Na+/H+-dicarboxylate symporter